MIKAWTLFHYPFAIGELWQPRACEVECSAPIPVGFGFSVVRITSPAGDHWYAEESSGGLQGSDLQQIIYSLKDFDPEILKRQVEEARKRGEGAQLVDSEEWWRRLTNAGRRLKDEAPAEPVRRRRTVTP